MNRPITALAVILSLCVCEARQDQVVCGSHAEKWKEELHLHRVADRLGSKRIRRASAALVAGQQEIGGMSVLPDSGNIAILDDSDGVISRRNTFNLDRKTLQFWRSGSKYRYVLSDGGYDAAAATAGTPIAGLGDDDTREVPLPFPFPFYGATYTRLRKFGWEYHVRNRGQRHHGPLPGRLTAGAPRIAPLFLDLDPSSKGSVSILSESGRVVVSWIQVPEFSDSGPGRCRRFRRGCIPMAASSSRIRA
jgi:hypothetical protein